MFDLGDLLILCPIFFAAVSPGTFFFEPPDEIAVGIGVEKTEHGLSCEIMLHCIKAIKWEMGNAY